MITRVYTKLDGKLAQWDVETSDTAKAINTVRRYLNKGHTSAIMAVVMKPVQLELF